MMEKVLFLDIDGVLQPPTQKRFEHIKEVDELKKQLSDKYGIDYSDYDKYDLLAVYYDWDKVAVAELRRILDTTGAKIVISSDWRVYNPMSCLKDYFRIYDLADYVTDYTPTWKYEEAKEYRKREEYKDIYEPRVIEILEYLKAHPEIKRWVALDDLYLDKFLKDNAIVTHAFRLVKADADRCIAILNG
jgi:response regulator RpfG family c-di-GMP phosphodiesterase